MKRVVLIVAAVALAAAFLLRRPPSPPAAPAVMPDSLQPIAAVERSVRLAPLPVTSAPVPTKAHEGHRR
jgi:hypothetical protein